MKIAVVIPVYNEEKYIVSFLRLLRKEVRSFAGSFTIIIVDDGSCDETALRIQQGIKKFHHYSILLQHRSNLGKGAAMRTGAEYALKKRADAVIFMDGDCQHLPRHLVAFIQCLEQYRLVFGYRDVHQGMSWVRWIGNRCISSALGLVFPHMRRDVLCGFMAMRADVYRQLRWSTHDYGVELELSLIVAKKRIPFTEVKIETVYLDKKTGLNLIDMIRALRKVPQWLTHVYQ